MAKAKKATKVGDLRLEIGKQETDNPPKPISVIKYGRMAMKRYGKYVIEDRALPDFHDGLKPVHRRLLWAMQQMGLKYNAQSKKSARLIGDVIGKYHPHGDMACYGALITVSGCKSGDNTSVPLADGEGNWFIGIMDDTPAAQRYTNTRMSRYTQENFFNPDYISCIDKVPNYDDTEVEPVVLPSLLPNLFVNGAFGIGVGITSVIPAYSLDSLKKVVEKLLKGDEVSPKTYAHTLKFNYPFGGGECTSDVKHLTELYKNNSANAEFKSLYRWDENKRKMTFYSFAPALNVPNIQLKLLGRSKAKTKPPAWIKHIADALDESNRDDGPCFSILFKKSSSKAEIDYVIKQVEEEFTSRMSYKINVTERLYKDGKEDVVFHSTTIPQLMEKWVTWRVALELRMLKHKIGVNELNQKKTSLHILACANLETIINSLRKDDPAAYLVEKLKVTLEDANAILELKVKQLSKLDNQKLVDNLAALKKENKQLNDHVKNPNEKIIEDIRAMKAA